MGNAKKWYRGTYLQNRNRLTDTDTELTDRENELMVTSREGLGDVRMGSLGATCTHWCILDG